MPFPRAPCSDAPDASVPLPLSSPHRCVFVSPTAASRHFSSASPRSTTPALPQSSSSRSCSRPSGTGSPQPRSASLTPGAEKTPTARPADQPAFSSLSPPPPGRPQRWHCQESGRPVTGSAPPCPSGPGQAGPRTAESRPSWRWGFGLLLRRAAGRLRRAAPKLSCHKEAAAAPPPPPPPPRPPAPSRRRRRPHLSLRAPTPAPPDWLTGLRRGPGTPRSAGGSRCSGGGGGGSRTARLGPLLPPRPQAARRRRRGLAPPRLGAPSGARTLPPPPAASPGTLRPGGRGCAERGGGGVEAGAAGGSFVRRSAGRDGSGGARRRNLPPQGLPGGRREGASSGVSGSASPCPPDCERGKTPRLCGERSQPGGAAERGTERRVSPRCCGTGGRLGKPAHQRLRARREKEERTRGKPHPAGFAAGGGPGAAVRESGSPAVPEQVSGERGGGGGAGDGQEQPLMGTGPRALQQPCSGSQRHRCVGGSSSCVPSSKGPR